MHLSFDHIAISAGSLDEGVAYVEDRLGLPLAGGGKHGHMGTHNRLMGMGDLYLEVIAIDPEAPRPDWPRWFDLDNFTGPPRLTNWVAGANDLDIALALCPPGIGQPVQLTRGDYRWRMAVPEDGKLPFDGLFPALIQWQGALRPAGALPNTGLRLTRLVLAHPEGAALARTLAPLIADPRIVVEPGPRPEMRAEFTTPHGPRFLS
jgi:hypothetical protein